MGQKIDKYLSRPLIEGEEDITGYDVIKATIVVVALFIACWLG